MSNHQKHNTMKHYNHAIAIAVPRKGNPVSHILMPFVIISVSFVLLFPGFAHGQNTERKTTATLQQQMPGKTQWLGKVMIEPGGMATQAQSGNMFEYISINQQETFWPAMQKEPITMVMTQVDVLPEQEAMIGWKKWLGDNQFIIAGNAGDTKKTRFSISFLVDAEGTLVEASIKGDGSLFQDSILQQFIQMKEWKAAESQGVRVAYRGYLNIIAVQ